MHAYFKKQNMTPEDKSVIRRTVKLQPVLSDALMQNYMQRSCVIRRALLDKRRTRARAIKKMKSFPFCEWCFPLVQRLR